MWDKIWSKSSVERASSPIAILTNLLFLLPFLDGQSQLQKILSVIISTLPDNEVRGGISRASPRFFRFAGFRSTKTNRVPRFSVDKNPS
jgi:hypothetical protein